MLKQLHSRSLIQNTVSPGESRICHQQEVHPDSVPGKEFLGMIVNFQTMELKLSGEKIRLEARKVLTAQSNSQHGP